MGSHSVTCHSTQVNTPRPSSALHGRESSSQRVDQTSDALTTTIPVVSMLTVVHTMPRPRHALIE